MKRRINEIKRGGEEGVRKSKMHSFSLSSSSERFHNVIVSVYNIARARMVHADGIRFVSYLVDRQLSPRINTQVCVLQMAGWWMFAMSIEIRMLPRNYSWSPILKAGSVGINCEGWGEGTSIFVPAWYRNKRRDCGHNGTKNVGNWKIDHR